MDAVLAVQRLTPGDAMNEEIKRAVNLELALEMVQVSPVYGDDPVVGWFSVATSDDGIIAYFHKESDALRFRLDLINRWLNP